MTNHKDSSTGESQVNADERLSTESSIYSEGAVSQATGESRQVGCKTPRIAGPDALMQRALFDTWLKEESDEARTAAWEAWQTKDRELAALQHDIKRHVQIATDQANEIAKLTAQLAVVNAAHAETIRTANEEMDRHREQLAEANARADSEKTFKERNYRAWEAACKAREKAERGENVHYNRLAGLLFSGALDSMTGKHAREYEAEYVNWKQRAEVAELRLKELPRTDSGLLDLNAICDQRDIAVRRAAQTKGVKKLADLMQRYINENRAGQHTTDGRLRITESLAKDCVAFFRTIQPEAPERGRLDGVSGNYTATPSVGESQLEGPFTPTIKLEPEQDGKDRT